jgi:hypothetical protein
MSYVTRVKRLENLPGANRPGVTIIYVHDDKSKAEAEEAERRGDKVIEYVDVARLNGTPKE